MTPTQRFTHAVGTLGAVVLMLLLILLVACSGEGE